MIPDPSPKHSTVRFGAFEFDLRRQELRRQGHRIKLPAAQMRLLKLFLERPGELITRDEITNHLWVDSANIDVSNGINTSINRLRANLGDPSGSAEYIETVIGLGYRFIAEVATDPGPAIESPEAHALSSDPTPAAQSGLNEAALVEISAASVARKVHRPVASRGWVAIGSLLFLAVAGGFLFRRIARARPVAAAVPVGNLSPSPFHLRPVTRTAPGETISEVAVSPDGKAVAYSNSAGVSVHRFDGSERLLPSRPFFQVSRISWFPDGTQVLISGSDTQTHRHQVWGAHTWDGYLRLFVDDADLATVSPDGTSIAYTRQNDTELWVASVDGGNPRKLRADAQGSFPYLIWSRNGDHLLVDHRAASLDSDTFEAIDAQSGTVLAHADGIAFTSGYLLDDGRLFFPVTGSANPAAGKTELMMVHIDPRTGKLLDKPQAQQSFGGYGRALSASRDGTRLALALDYSTVSVFVADLHQPGPTLENVAELPHGVEESFPHAWTPDGRAVLSESDALGTWAIFKQPLDVGESQLVAKLPKDAAMAQISPDGRWVLFLEFPDSKSLPIGVFRASFTGGDAKQVPTSGQIQDFRCPASGVCVVREPVGNTELVYYALDPVTGMGRELARTPWHPIVLGDWGLSPDGSTISVTDHNLEHPTIQLLPLSGGNAPIPSAIPLGGHGALLGSSWAADGRSLFVQCRTKDGFELVSLGLNGRATLLRKSTVPLWGIPSRDGKKIAFPDRTSSDNVWASDNMQ